MKVSFLARHFDATDKLKKFAEDEVEKLSKYLNGDLKADIVLSEKENFKAVEIRVTMFGKLLPTRVEGTDFYKIIPEAVDKVERQVRDTKEKVTGR